jgi:hypothetical protein
MSHVKRICNKKGRVFMLISTKHGYDRLTQGEMEQLKAHFDCLDSSLEVTLPSQPLFSPDL